MKKGQIHDFYFQKAKREDYSARSVYKLQNIQEKYKLITAGAKVLDLGASPGSWSEYVSTLLGKTGFLLSLDLNPLSPAAQDRIKKSGVQFTFLQQSVFDPLPTEIPPLDAVISDMAPSTQGNRTVDSGRSLELTEAAFSIAQKHLRAGGHFVVKLFQSNETVAAAKQWGKTFDFSKLYRPPAVRKESKEVYFIGQNFKVESSQS